MANPLRRHFRSHDSVALSRLSPANIDVEKQRTIAVVRAAKNLNMDVPLFLTFMTADHAPMNFQ